MNLKRNLAAIFLLFLFASTACAEPVPEYKDKNKTHGSYISSQSMSSSVSGGKSTTTTSKKTYVNGELVENESATYVDGRLVEKNGQPVGAEPEPVSPSASKGAKKAGFRDMSIGDPLSKLGSDAKYLGEAKNKEKAERTKSGKYSRPSDKMFVGDIPLTKIEYLFNNDVLTDIYVYSGREYFEDLLKVCRAKYGPERNKYVGGKTKALTYSWQFDDVTIQLKKMKDKTWLYIYNLKASKLSRNDSDENSEKTVKTKTSLEQAAEDL